MRIDEAIMRRTKDNPYITRVKWAHSVFGIGLDAVKIYPTNTPHCCIIESAVTGGPHRGWQPTLEDLTATDWIVTE